MTNQMDKDTLGDVGVKLWRKRRVILLFTAIALILVFVAMLITIFGLDNKGLPITISEDLSKKGVVLCEDVTTESAKSLEGPKLSKVQPTQQPLVRQEILTNGLDLSNTSEDSLVYNLNGGYQSADGYFSGYTFYVKNTGEESCNVASTLKITRVSRHMDEVVWIWVFTSRGMLDENGEIASTFEQDTDGVIYKKKDTVDKDYKKIFTGAGYYGDTSLFEEGKTIKTDSYQNLKSNEFVKISIFMWIDGNDTECSSGSKKGNVEGGSIRIGMNFVEAKQDIVNKA